jgi:dGTPase
MQYENELLQGTLQKPLIDYLPDAEIEIVKKIDDFSVKHIYNHRSVVEIEIAGYNVIGGLLKEFYTALMNPASSKSKKILQLISRQFPVKTEKNSFYNDLQSIVDFTAGMTDLYAVEMYRNIKGISFPQIK